MPKSVFRYELDKVRCLNLETSFPAMLTLDSRDICGAINNVKNSKSFLKNSKSLKSSKFSNEKGKGRKKDLFVYFTQISTSGNACALIHRYHGNRVKCLFGLKI